MKIIGVGVGRTGTLSLKSALEVLGLGPCFHGRHVLDHPDRLALWEAASAGEPVDWRAVFRGYRATVDWPGAAYWRELLAAFPDAKVILTVREPQGWYDSVDRTIYPMFGSGADPRAQHAMRIVPGLDVFTAFHRRMIWNGFFDGRFADRDHAIAVYQEHNAAVIREVPAERLLVIQPGDGWKPLCDFLGLPVPVESYPHLNDPGRFWGRVAARMEEALQEG
ncbi:sulfotransferase family protein [Acrocarpospora corrugata]|uniref:Sulfotransferase family protein n=1 Tax=Acrocarpospora corrugata TaxID=35763 RepID=A0A5M3WBU8_9ACTN|nr:sulfotransferase family protein [Acrocarpospora corrugata]GES05522.1 sulfotransferase family protein [Acrocarpospora corrugata]